MSDKKCILYEDKICDNCGECDMCDLDPDKICDNCGKCIDYDPECKYAKIDIDKIIIDNSQ